MVRYTSIVGTPRYRLIHTCADLDARRSLDIFPAQEHSHSQLTCMYLNYRTAVTSVNRGVEDRPDSLFREWQATATRRLGGLFPPGFTSGVSDLARVFSPHERHFKRATKSREVGCAQVPPGLSHGFRHWLHASPPRLTTSTFRTPCAIPLWCYFCR